MEPLAYRAAPYFWQQYARNRKRAVLPSPFRPDWKAWGGRGLYAAWLGHATVLIKMDGFTILTDPVFSTRVGLDLRLATLGPKRLVAPALEAAQLPRIDLVLLSHAHMDHFDLPSLRQLERRGTAVITASKTADLLRPKRWASVRELGWGGRAQSGPFDIRAFEVNHWGARMRTDTYRGYNGYTIEAAASACSSAATRRTPRSSAPCGARSPTTSPSCRWAPTTPGSTTTATRSRRAHGGRSRGRVLYCRSTIRRSR